MMTFVCDFCYYLFQLRACLFTDGRKTEPKDQKYNQLNPVISSEVKVYFIVEFANTIWLFLPPIFSGPQRPQVRERGPYISDGQELIVRKEPLYESAVDVYCWRSDELFILQIRDIVYFPGGSVVKNPRANAGDSGDGGSVPGWGISLGGGNDNSLQYSCLKNSMDGRVWWAAVHGHKELDKSAHTCTGSIIQAHGGGSDEDSHASGSGVLSCDTF